MSKKELFCLKHNEIKILVGKKKTLRCQKCHNEYRTKWRKNNPYYKEKNRLYFQKNKERQQAWLQKDRKENPQKYKDYDRKGYVLNFEITAMRKKIKKYGITLEQYEEMLIKQDYRCAICKKSETRKTGKYKKTATLCVDHCHITKLIRGLLCFECNILLGKAKDSRRILRFADEYLSPYKDENDEFHNLEYHIHV